jgi:hypothetical protein
MADTNRRARDAGAPTVSATAADDGRLDAFADRGSHHDDVTATPCSKPVVAMDARPAATAQHRRRPIDDRPSNQQGEIQ